MLSFPLPSLVIDTREQKPLDFTPHIHRYDSITTSTLQEGDYTAFMPGDTRRICFERKSLQDLIQTLVAGKDRFKRELERLLPYYYRAIIIESTFLEVASPYQFSAMNPNSILGLLQSIQLQYGVDVIFAGTRQNSATIITDKIEDFFNAKT